MFIPEKFPSKVDSWLVVVFGMGVLFIAICTYSIWSSSSSSASLLFKIVISAILVGAAALIISILYGTSYTFDDYQLVIRSSVFRWRIPLRTVKSIQPSTSLLSSPACSLDRLEIEHDEGSILISPRDKAQFVEVLKKRAPQVRVLGFE